MNAERVSHYLEYVTLQCLCPSSPYRRVCFLRIHKGKEVYKRIPPLFGKVYTNKHMFSDCT